MAVLQNIQNWQGKIEKRLGIDLSSYRAIVYGIGILLVLGGSYVIGATDKGLWVVAGVLGLVMGITVMIRPHIGMYILVAFIYTNMSTVLTEAFGLPSLNKILVALIFVSVIGTQVMMRQKPLVFRLTEGTVMLYLFWVAIATFVSVGLNAETFDDIVDSSKDFLIIFIIVQLAAEEQVWKKAQYLLIGCAVFLSILTWYQFTTHDFKQDFFGLATSRTDSVEDGGGSEFIDFYRVGGPLGDPNFYSQILLMVYPLALYRVLDNYSNKNDKMVGAVAATFIGGAIVFTYSRAALMVFMAITFFILLERRINIIKVGIVVCAILILAVPVLPKGYLERMGSIVGIGGAADGEADESSTGRASEALVAIQMFLDHPIMGIGYGRYEPNYLDYSIYLGLDSRLEDRQAHNMYLEAAAETGIVGLALLFFMFGTIFYAIYRARQQLPQIGRPDLIPWLAALQFGLLAYLLSSIFLHDDYVRYLRLSTGLAVSSTALVEAIIAKQAAKRERERLAQFDEEVPMLANTY